MVPRLPFQEWEGFNARESGQQMTGASSGLTLLTLADIKTAAWLVDNNHLTHLETVTFTTDMDTQSVNTEVQTIKRLAGNVFTMSDDQIFGQVKGIIRIIRCCISVITDMMNICSSRRDNIWSLPQQQWSEGGGLQH